MIRHGRIPVGSLAAAVAVACASTVPPVPSPACAGLWADSAAVAFADGLARATLSGAPAWPGYDLSDPVFVLYAGDAPSGEACLGAWSAGRVVAYRSVPDAPTMSTPLYGFHLPEADTATASAGRPRGTQPAAIRAWLGELGFDRATILPVEVEGFPMELPTLVKVQLALHEGFHAHVQSRHWLGSAPNWPEWDRQPDRSAIGACYRDTPSVEAAFAAERERLAVMVESLLDGDSAAACRAAGAFLDGRSARYGSLTQVSVARHDGTPGTCWEAEAIMELEEGAADYASWPRLLELGEATREQLMRRYRARQADAFYLTGAMQLHAIELMDPARTEERLRRIAESTSPETGSIGAVFEEAVGEYCR